MGLDQARIALRVGWFLGDGQRIRSCLAGGQYDGGDPELSELSGQLGALGDPQFLETSFGRRDHCLADMAGLAGDLAAISQIVYKEDWSVDLADRLPLH